MVVRHRLLLIDDDELFSASLATLLESTGLFTVMQVGTGAAAYALLADNAVQFDGILVDIGLPDENGITLVRRLRADNIVVPIILITGSTDEQLLVKGLQVGADDFVRKPFRGTELMARLHSRLRAFAYSRDAAVPIGRYTFHPGRRTLYDQASNSRITLADKEAKLLWHLYYGVGDAVSRTDLLHAIWGYSSTATTHTVETHIYRLRQKIEANPARPTLIVTERGGYRLVMQEPESRTPLTFPLTSRGAAPDPRTLR